MVVALYIAALAALAAGGIAGAASGSGIGFFAAVLNGFITAALCAGLARSLEKQEELVGWIQALYDGQRRQVPHKACTHCGGEYDGNLSSCPHCGRRNAENQTKG